LVPNLKLIITKYFDPNKTGKVVYSLILSIALINIIVLKNKYLKEL